MDEDEVIHLGPMVTHNHCVASKLIVEHAFPLAQAAWEVGAPQIRNRGTVAGNLITASPANDTITPLMALGASGCAWPRCAANAWSRCRDFYTGVRRTVMQPDEMLVDISFPAMQANQRGIFIKLGLRRAQAIAVVNVAILLTFGQKSGLTGPLGPSAANRLDGVVITLGAVAPTIIHARNAEMYLKGLRTERYNDRPRRHAGDASQPPDRRCARVGSLPLGDGAGVCFARPARIAQISTREMVFRQTRCCCGAQGKGEQSPYPKVSYHQAGNTDCHPHQRPGVYFYHRSG